MVVQFFLLQENVQYERVAGIADTVQTHQADDIGRCIRQVVQGIGHDGDGTEQRAHGELAQAEQNIAHHAHDAGQIAIGGPGVRVLRIVGVTDKQTDQQLRHKKPPGQRWQPAYPMSLV